MRDSKSVGATCLLTGLTVCGIILDPVTSEKTNGQWLLIKWCRSYKARCTNTFIALTHHTHTVI